LPLSSTFPVLGKNLPSSQEEIKLWDKLAKGKMNEERVYYKDNRHPDLHTERCVKINNAVALCYLDYKARN